MKQETELRLTCSANAAAHIQRLDEIGLQRSEQLCEHVR